MTGRRCPPRKLGFPRQLALPVKPPLLRAELSGPNLVLSWPAAAQNVRLQVNTNLADPAAWTTLTNVPVIVNEQNTLTDPVAGARRFYRLRQQ